MEIRIKQGYLLLLTIAMIATSCSDSSATLPTTPDLGIPIGEYNKNIKVIAPEGWNTYRIDDLIGLNMEVLGVYPIAFDLKNGTRIFYLDDNEWVEVGNKVNEPEGYFILEPANGDAFKTGGTDVRPNLNDLTKTTTVRIVLLGNLVKDKQISNDIVAGYVDVTLNP